MYLRKKWEGKKCEKVRKKHTSHYKQHPLCQKQYNSLQFEVTHTHKIRQQIDLKRRWSKNASFNAIFEVKSGSKAHKKIMDKNAKRSEMPRKKT